MKTLLHIYVYRLLVVLPGVASTADGPVEEVTVIGSRDQLNMQMAIDTAEDNFSALLNTLVDAEFRVNCAYEVVLGTRIKQRVCQTQYQKDALTKAAMYSSRGMPYNANALLTQKNREMSRRARELIETNTALREAASRLSGLVEEYQSSIGNPKSPKTSPTQHDLTAFTRINI